MEGKTHQKSQELVKHTEQESNQDNGMLVIPISLHTKKLQCAQFADAETGQANLQQCRAKHLQSVIATNIHVVQSVPPGTLCMDQVHKTVGSA